MVMTCLGRGLRAARREWRLALLLWIISLLLAAPVALPALRWWKTLVDHAPEANRMLTGLRVGVLAELMSSEHADGWGVLFASILGLIVLARLLHAFFMGGLVQVLADRRHPTPARPDPVGLPASPSWPAGTDADQITARCDPPLTAAQTVMTGDVAAAFAVAPAAVEPLAVEGPSVGARPLAQTVAASDADAADVAHSAVQPMADAGPAAVARPAHPPALLHSFFGGAGRFFLRNLVMLVLNALGALVVGGALVALARLAVRPLEDTLSAPLAWTRLLLPVTLAGLVIFFFLMVYDYACLRLVLEDSRRPVRTWLKAVGFVSRRFAATAGLWLGPWTLLACVAALYLAVRAAMPATTIGTIALMIGLQQAFTIVRATLRVATVAAEMAYGDVRGFLPNV